jgi:flavorubredoxin
MGRGDWVDTVNGALDLLQNMAAFYCKYHLLSAEERRFIHDELKDTHQSFLSTKQLVQQHVNIIKWRMEELIGHYEVWIADEHVAGKKWRLHPREELKRLLSDAEKVTEKMDSLIRQGPR